jgi:hypothetical protein
VDLNRPSRAWRVSSMSIPAGDGWRPFHLVQRRCGLPALPDLPQQMRI